MPLELINVQLCPDLILEFIGATSMDFAPLWRIGHEANGPHKTQEKFSKIGHSSILIMVFFLPGVLEELISVHSNQVLFETH